MSTVQWQRRNRRALILGAAVAVPIVLYRFVVAPYVGTMTDLHHQVDRERELLARELHVVAEAPSYPARTREVFEALQDRARELFGGPDQLSATASMVNMLGTLARDHRVLLQRSETAPGAEIGDGVLRLEATLRGQSDLHGILEFLLAIESAERLLRVDRITIEQTQRTGGPPGRRDEEVLTFTAVVQGFALTGAGGAGLSTIGAGG